MDAFRLYEPSECGPDGYPLAWHGIDGAPGVKHLVREQAGHRCIRCSHPYEGGTHGRGEWTTCDSHCMHAGPLRCLVDGEVAWQDEIPTTKTPSQHGLDARTRYQARWRILTVHHLRLGIEAKRDLRWWNLAALCQRCHLQIQGKVVMERIWPWPHSEWFKPYAAGWYAHAYLGEDLTREQVEVRLDELLGLELAG